MRIRHHAVAAVASYAAGAVVRSWCPNPQRVQPGPARRYSRSPALRDATAANFLVKTLARPAASSGHGCVGISLHVHAAELARGPT